VNTISTEHFTSLYFPAWKRKFTPKTIKAGFAASGLIPFNPKRDLRTVPKPAAERTISTTNKVPCRQDAAQSDEVPQTL
jgi:hypothetical protein